MVGLEKQAQESSPHLPAEVEAGVVLAARQDSLLPEQQAAAVAPPGWGAMVLAEQ